MTLKEPVLDALARAGYRAAYRILRLWWWLRRPRARGAGVAAWCDGRLLVVRTSYRELVDLPGGGVNRGETNLAAAVRELREEVGIEVAADRLRHALSVEFEQEGRRIEDTLFEWTPEAPFEPRIDRREIVWAAWRTPEELQTMRLAPGLEAYLAWRRRPAEPSGRPG